jgi:hypothetical protein
MVNRRTLNGRVRYLIEAGMSGRPMKTALGGNSAWKRNWQNGFQVLVKSGLEFYTDPVSDHPHRALVTASLPGWRHP